MTSDKYLLNNASSIEEIIKRVCIQSQIKIIQIHSKNMTEINKMNKNKLIRVNEISFCFKVEPE